MSRPIDLVFAGNLLVDDVVHRDGSTRMGEAGGAILFAALGASLWGARCGLASVAGDDYPAGVLEALGARGIDTAGVARLGRPGGRAWLLYEASGRRIVHHAGRPSHRDVSPAPERMPDAYRDAWGVHLSPMPFECQREWIVALAAAQGRFVSVDPHEPVREDNLDAWRDLLASVDACFPGPDELRLDAGPDARALVRRLASGRLGLVAFKRGAQGGTLVQREPECLLAWAAVETPVVDPTGAGDAFAGGFLAGLRETGQLDRALGQGAVAASFAIGDWGARGLLGATRAAAEARLDAWLAARARG